MSHKAAISNTSVNFLNAHFSIRRFAEDIGGIFGPIYLYQIGFEFRSILLVWIIGQFLRLILRPIVVALLPKIGLKNFIIFGTFCFAGMYPVLSMVTEANIWLYIFILYIAVTDITYWLPYHIYFTHLSDERYQGKQVGIRSIFVNTLTMFSPLVGGTLIAFQSYEITFAVIALFFFISLIPLRYLEDHPLKEIIHFKQVFKEVSFHGSYIYCLWGMLEIPLYFVWNIVLYQMLQDTFSMGGILFIGIFFRMILSYFVGHSIDMKKKGKLYMYGALFTAIALIGKILFAYTIPIIIIFDAILMLGGAILSTYIETIVYKYSQKSKNKVWFQFMAETGWDIGVILISLAILLLLTLGVELRNTMFLGLLALPLFIYLFSSAQKEK